MAAPMNKQSRAMELPLFTIDAFTSVPFAGNPAAVCLVPDQKLSDETMQKVATEMNISETAFVQKLHSQDTFENSSRFGLRWFTPTNEVPLCGHATLASAAALYEITKNTSSEIVFETLSGELVARKMGDCISLDLPLNPTVKEEENEPDLQHLIQISTEGLDVTDVQYSATTKKLLLRLDDNYGRHTLEGLSPPHNLMLHAHNTGKIKGVIVTLRGDANNGCTDASGETYDFVSRYFAPWNGIPEDPVTGSAHTVLAAYWSKQLGKKDLYARQCSKRGGELRIKVGDNGRVDVAGYATVVVEGKLRM
ncbi:phenazine biosynthesis-like domain-containing protein isoform X2 [Lineus longissimus]|uniref:phenazine biosynthesis-like domain-containing protein isoform X2 n=1 Tax=Lineus longissimus TaxID=88925 RepID=UPI00315DD58E